MGWEMEVNSELDKIVDQFTYLAQGAFDLLQLVPDSTDIISSVICMTGEEIRVKTLSRDYYERVINACTDMVFILDGGGRIAEVNDAACTWLGLGRQGLLGQPLGDIPFWVDMPFSGDLTLPIHRLPTASGQWLPVQLRATYLPEGWGRQKDILVMGKPLRLDGIAETLRLALEATRDAQEQSILRECLALCARSETPAAIAKIRLTRRERTILPLVARGLTSREIAKSLGILEPTVNKHRENLRRKFGVHNTVDLVLAAKRSKFIK